MPDTGFPGQDAQSDFSRARRRQVLARLANRLRREPADVHLVLPFEEVREALGPSSFPSSGSCSRSLGDTCLATRYSRPY